MKAVKKFRRAIAIFMAVCMLFSLVTGAGAADYRNNKTNIEIVFDGDVGETVTSSGIILCFFGHRLVENILVSVQHSVFTNPRRCVKTTTIISRCASCGYVDSISEVIEYIFCCF